MKDKKPDLHMMAIVAIVLIAAITITVVNKSQYSFVDNSDSNPITESQSNDNIAGKGWSYFNEGDYDTVSTTQSGDCPASCIKKEWGYQKCYDRCNAMKELGSCTGCDCNKECQSDSMEDCYKYIDGNEYIDCYNYCMRNGCKYEGNSQSNYCIEKCNSGHNNCDLSGTATLSGCIKKCTVECTGISDCCKTCKDRGLKGFCSCDDECSDWVKGECGVGECEQNQIQSTRTCPPESGCETKKCEIDSECGGNLNEYKCMPHETCKGGKKDCGGQDESSCNDLYPCCIWTNNYNPGYECFLEETNIATPYGSKYIQDIKVGDKVISYNNKVSNVLQTFKHDNVKEYLIINGVLKLTPNHPIMIDDEWKEARSAAIGDKLKDILGRDIIIESIELVEEPVSVYNLDVDGSSTYYAESILVHNKDCFIAGTKISMADGSEKNIEDVKIGDLVKTFNTMGKKVENKRVLALLSQYHIGKGNDITIMIRFSDGNENQNTNTHPYYVENKGWSSYDPKLTKERYGIDVEILEVGDTVYKLENNEIKKINIVDIDEIYEGVQTYNLMKVKDNNNFFANGILVHNKYGDDEYCKDGICQEMYENSVSCPEDCKGENECTDTCDSKGFRCGSVCGEQCGPCPEGYDCYTDEGLCYKVSSSVCPNEKCEEGEDIYNCPQDCSEDTSCSEYGQSCWSLDCCAGLECCEDDYCAYDCYDKNSCSSDYDCASGEVCEFGECVISSGGCSSDWDCGYGEVCESGECVEGGCDWWDIGCDDGGEGGDDDGGCFIAGTKIRMADGSEKNIENIKLGDIVKSYSEINKKTEPRQVKKTLHHKPEDMRYGYYIIINNKVKVTPEHRVYTDKRIVEAKDLKIGSLLLDEDKNLIKVESIEKVFKRIKTYNIEVEENHNYFAEGFLVHNEKDESTFWSWILSFFS